MGHFSRTVRFIAALLALASLLLASNNAAPTAKNGNTSRTEESASLSVLPNPSKSIKSQRTPQATKWAESQLRRMTLDEKIGQLISIGVNGKFLNQDSEEYQALVRQVRDFHVGGIVLFRGPVYESVHLVNRMQRLARYPLLISADMEYGAGMRFDDTVKLPTNMAIGATGDPHFALRQGEIIAREANALGVKQIFGPVVDVNNNPGNPIINVRSYGQEPDKVAQFSRAFVIGAQSQGVLATAKHFPGHGDTATDSHRGLPLIEVTRGRLDSVELVPYRAVMNAGVASVMASFIGLPLIDPTIIRPLTSERATGPSELVQGGEIVTANSTLPAALSPLLIHGLLRTDLNFDGLIVTDALDMSALTIYFNQDEAAVRAVEAGVDMLVKPSDIAAVMRGLRQASQKQPAIKVRIEESARRVLAVKYDLGLVHNRYTSLERIDLALSNSEVVQFADEVANRAVTLVRDDNQQVPLHSRANSTIFNFAITNGDDRAFVASPFEKEMSDGGRRMVTVVLDERSSPEDIDKAMQGAQGADLIIASLYGRVRAGESASAGLPEASTRALTQLINSGKPVVGISFGNPYLLQSFPKLPTYIVTYGDMPSLQQAAARIVLGKIGSSGKLPIELPALYPVGTGIERARPDRITEP